MDLKKGNKMNTQMTRIDLVQQIRSLYDLESRNAIHFTREEMMKIANYITGVECPWTDSANYFLDYLRTYGYTEQLTVDTHPTSTNLNWLVTMALEIKEIEKQAQKTESVEEMFVDDTWLNLLKNSLEITKVDTVSFQDKTLIVTFK